VKSFAKLTAGLLLTLILTTPIAAQSTNTTTRATQDTSIAATANAQDPGAQRQQQTRPQQPGVTPATQVPPLSAEDERRLQAARQRRQQEAATGTPDVLLDVPNLSVQEITLEVDNLKAHLALDARLANLLQLTAGVDVGIDKVKLTIKGVRAEALLKVRLDNVADIIDRTLTTIDRNPQMLERLLQSVDKAVGTVGGVANTALQPGGVVDKAVGAVGQTLSNVTQPGGLLTQTVNTLGQTVQRTLDTTGNILERTLDNTGKVLNEKTLGNVANLGLSVVKETTNSAGQIVRQLRDVSGAIIEVTLDEAGKIISSKVIQQATGTRR
jgi:hypothetical protein